ncbi:MAG: polyprenol monophosphomannose synthase [Chloroflexi bacterium]|nr:polyprenol monophosphomannose synthase [Chloroflexota bacterium]
MKTVIVLPTYNEAQNLPRMIDALLDLDLNGAGPEILVIDDGSPDGTGDIAEESARRYPVRVHVMHRQGKLGLGSAYRAGFEWALNSGADYIVQMDCDFSHPVDKVPAMVKAAASNEVVIGSRYVKGGSVDRKWSLKRKLLSSWGNRYARLVTGVKVKDVTSGFKCWTRKALEGMPLSRVSAGGFTFQIEMNYVANRKGYRMAEVPILFTERERGQSKMSGGIILEGFWRVWQMRFKKY